MSHLIPVGKSQGILIPEAIIQQAGLQSAELTLKVVPEGLLISPVRKVRQGWAKACKIMSRPGKDKTLLEETILNKFDKEEWQW